MAEHPRTDLLRLYETAHRDGYPEPWCDCSLLLEDLIDLLREARS